MLPRQMSQLNLECVLDVADIEFVWWVGGGGGGCKVIFV